MGTGTPAEGGEGKPALKAEGIGGVGSNRKNRHQNNVMKKEKFMGAHPDLQGFVFEAGSTRTNQIAKFTTVDTRIRALIGQQFDPMVLESIEKMTVTVPPEPNIVTESDGSVSKMEEIKYGKKYDRWLTRTEKIEKEMKQVYSIYYGQCDEDIKASLAEHAQFEVANQEKDVIQLYKILQSVNFSYRSNQEPILTMWNAKADFIKLRQQKQQTVQEYYERFIAMRDVNETLGNNIHDDLGFVEVIAKENGEDPSTLADKKKDRVHRTGVRTYDGDSHANGCRPGQVWICD